MLSIAPPAPGTEIDLRQLRHHTKNALQRILCQIGHCRDLQATPDGRRLVEDLERRIRLSSAVSDALFGLVGRPGPLAARLRQLGEATIELLADEDQFIRFHVVADPAVPARWDNLLLRIANEFIGNAIKHGLYERCAGTLAVTVQAGPGGQVVLRVSDDGWGIHGAPGPGEGLRLARILAQGAGGTAGVACREGLTVAEAVLNPA